ncbi:unnamed protein product, partial [Linum tenue]
TARHAVTTGKVHRFYCVRAFYVHIVYCRYRDCRRVISAVLFVTVELVDDYGGFYSRNLNVGEHDSLDRA